MFSRLNEGQFDALREVSNIGAGHAVTALNQMTQKVVMLEVPEVTLVPFKEVVSRLGGPEEEVVGLFFRVFGEARGNMLIAMPKTSAAQLVKLLFGHEPSSFGDMEISALKEIGNILSSSYLNAMGSLLKRTFIPSIPAFSLDMAQAVVDLLLIELAEVTNEALVIETFFRSRDQSFDGHFFLLPNPHSIDFLLEAIDKGR
ncbi:MAG TPA: chemotaxis protein CheC [Acidobacteriota bacterium]|nr:chemotaxis protein CheC [Acidobacteriota bacterium]HNT17948.1 chemotaxis protein CheC [Acidobacteriota bacterium]HPA27638.1 chemotaxis protein CheC [Acidobacteriota bacterium]HQO18915.1 chemotaxis protein CheC [Acidobacteriota bacterium]HQQ46425.1 chemotaxis protein CheC [Acidobacteriota bacterium]